MTRLTLAATSFAALAAACVTPPLPDTGGQPDAAPPIDAAPPDAPEGCELRVQNVGTGYHNPGTACLDCHQGQQPGAPYFSTGGTIYKDAAGTIPKVGATVIVIDGNGVMVKMPTMRNGNFYTSIPLSPPFTTWVSECPDNVPMISNFVDPDCNSCHRETGQPGRVVFPR